MENPNWFNVLLLSGSIQGIILILALYHLRKGNHIANRLLGVYIGLLSVMLVWRAVYVSDFGGKHFQGLFFACIVYFLFGPVLYIYIKQILSPVAGFNLKKEKVLFLYATAFIVTYIIQAIIFPQSSSLTECKARTTFKGIYWWSVYLGATIHNVAYLIKSYKFISFYGQKTAMKPSYKAALWYLKFMLSLIGGCVVFWLIYAFSTAFNLSSVFLGYFFESIWVIIPLNIYALGYFVLARPEIFTRPETTEKEKTTEKKQLSPVQKKYAASSLNDERLLELRSRLEEFMQAQKPFLNSGITALKLAKMLKTNGNDLSRTINECYGQSFPNFINGYRIDEFIRLVQDEKYRHYTYLALAYEVGFNSKSTFNKAFKKEKEMTPRDYFKRDTSPGNSLAKAG